ncbi:MAG: tetratricopeptide repeat protein [Myxococcales bacterium]|nr:tetratricopeptide repeat protein [Myxococcales bacterium]
MSSYKVAAVVVADRRVYDPLGLSDNPSSSRSDLLPQAGALVALLVVPVLIYGTWLAVPFVFDDEHAIVQNPSLGSLWASLDPPVETPTAGRPLVNLSLALNRTIGGFDPWGFHAFNLFVHMLVGLLAFAAVKQLVHEVARSSPAARGRLRARAVPAAFMASALWLVHPMHSEVVLYTIQRSESLMALCLMTALVAFQRALVLQGPSGWWAASVLACGAGVYCKAVIAVFPLLALAYDRAFVAGSLRAVWSQRRLLHLALLATWIPLGLLQLSQPRPGSVGAPGYSYWLAQGHILLDYARSALWPSVLVGDYGPLVAGQFRSPWPLVGVCGAAAFALWAAWRFPRVGFAGLWPLLLLLPTSVPTIYTEIGAERRMYLPLLAPAALIAVVVAVRLKPGAGRYLFGAGMLLALLLGARAYVRSADYRSTESFWQATVRARPTNPRAHYNLAEQRRRNGRLEEAIRGFEQALAIDAGYVEAHANLAGALSAVGRRPAALEHARRAADLRPSPLLLTNLAGYLATSGHRKEAATTLRSALALQPDYLPARRALAALLLALGRCTEASPIAAALRREHPAEPSVERLWRELEQGCAARR